MYEREKTVLLRSSASLLPNNICRIFVNGEMYAGVLHKDEVNIVSVTTQEVETKLVVATGAVSSTTGVTVMQASWVEVRERALLVLATTSGVFIYDWDGAVLLFSHFLPPTPPDAPYAFVRGIASLYTGYICVGTHTGEILVINVGEEGEMGIVEKVRWHARPITTLASHGQVLVSGDDAGDITIAQDNKGLAKMCSIESYGFPVTCLATWGGNMLAGYLSGHLRIFNLENGQIVAEVCGHVRCITGLDVARETGLVLTTSEDTFTRVWQLNPRPDLPIEHKYSQSEENVALCGGTFTDDLGSGYVVTGYDRRDIFCYAM
ncbi:WD repeat-containing protein 54-like [Panulirus ornatus]|uniref:WD repeat-containing protein 54-like n=1 Tax=Panulirus ornatus TaxID=150431 RepID=UPI003A8A539D